MDDLGSTDPSVNCVARFAAFAAAQGFRAIWAMGTDRNDLIERVTLLRTP